LARALSCRWMLVPTSCSPNWRLRNYWRSNNQRFRTWYNVLPNWIYRR